CLKARRYLFPVSRFFFFSSRRRHTRFSRDWSSDVCSSDLRGRAAAEIGAVAEVRAAAEIAAECGQRIVLRGRVCARSILLKNAAQVVDRLLQFLVACVDGRHDVVSDGCFLRCHKTTIPFETCLRRAAPQASSAKLSDDVLEKLFLRAVGILDANRVAGARAAEF